jgi:hypothetical protein
MRTSIVLVTVGVVVTASGCARKHLTPQFGTANREAFLAQRARAPDQPAPRPNMALDPQETSVISESYLRGLSGKAARGEPEPMLYVAPQPSGGSAQRLAPSVPRE